MGKTIINYPFGNGLYMFIPPIYDEIGDGLLLFYHHYTFDKWCDSVLIIGISGHNSIAQVMAKHVENYVLNMPQQ